MAKTDNELTPMKRQYNAIKEENKVSTGRMHHRSTGYLIDRRLLPETMINVNSFITEIIQALTGNNEINFSLA